MRHSHTPKMIVFILVLSMLVPLVIAPPISAQDRSTGTSGKQTPPSTIKQSQAGTMPGQIDKAKILAEAREYVARKNITATRLKVTQESVEQYRNDLIAILVAQKSALIGFNLPGTNRIDTAIASLQTMSVTDLAKLKDVADLSSLKALIVQQSQVIVTGVELRKRDLALRQQERAAAVAAGLYPGPFPEAEYSVLCPLNPQPSEALFAAGVIFVAAELVAALANVGCEQEVFGTNGKLVCIITEIIRTAAHFAFFYVEFCAENTDGAQIQATYERLEYIKDQLNFSIQNDNNNKAMLSTQLTNAENHIVTNDNNNTATLTSQAAAAQMVRIRQSVEANLASDLTTVTGVSLFQLPASRGGYLEVARQILIDTYNAQVAAAGAGVVIYNPSAELSLGATYTAQGRYREAYYQYRKGYRSVVKFP